MRPHSKLFREYPQLVCRRDLGVTSVSDLYSVGIRQAKDLMSLQREKAKKEERAAKVGYWATTDQSYVKELQELNQEIRAIDAKIQIAQGTRSVELILINEGDEQLQVSQTSFRNLGDVTWYQLTRGAPKYQSIRTRTEVGQQGMSPTEVGLLRLETNPNACFLSVDRLGTDKELTALQKINNDPAKAREFNLVDLDDGKFDDTVIQGIPVYAPVDLKAKNILNNLRAKRPDGSEFSSHIPVVSWFLGKGVRNVSTLAVRTLLVANQTWYDNGKVYNDPVLRKAMQDGIVEIKARFQDPALK